MSSFQIRPRFRQTISESPDAVEARLVQAIREQGVRCEVKHYAGFICLRIPEEDRHFWSPRLNLSFEGSEDGETIVRGTYGPNANVWSLFLYGYILVGVLGCISGILAFCQHMIGNYPWAYWIFGLTVAAGIGMYVMAQVGQKLGAQQTFQLHQIYESAMGSHVSVH